MNTFIYFTFMLMGLAGCDRDDQIRVYSAPKEAQAAPMAQATQPAATDGEITWTLPAGWVQDPPKQMRVASFHTSNDPSSPEVVISRFAAGNFGTPLDNINRWRGMVGLEPVNDVSAHKAEKITLAGKDSEVFDIQGKEKRLRIAMVPAGEQVWFFRLVGTSDEVAKQLDTFDAFLKSVQFK
jgi:hypothetical protein